MGQKDRGKRGGKEGLKEMGGERHEEVRGGGSSRDGGTKIH